MESSQNSKGKSRYTYGRRRSRSLGGIISKEICEQIDDSLPPEERLKLVIEHSLRNALVIVERELCTRIDPDKYCKIVSALNTTIETTLTEHNIYASAISGDEKFEASKFWEDNVTLYNEAAAKIDEEITQWDTLLSKEREELNNCPKEVPQTIAFEGSLDCGELKTMNYTEIAKDMSDAIASYALKFKDLKRIQKKLNHFTVFLELYKDYVNKEGHQYSTNMIDGTPRTFIKKFSQRQ